MIVDAHCHAGKGDGLSGPWNTDAPLEAYLRRAGAAGIRRTVVFAAFSDDNERANAEVARIVTRHPRRFTGFAFVHSKRDRGRIERLVGQAVEKWGFRGIKVHFHDAPITREVCEVAQRYQVPVLYDVGGEAYRVEMVAPQYPQVNFIIPHLGSFADDWRAHLQLIDQLVRHPNVYADTAGVRRFDYLVEAVRRAGPHKLLFGSDGPWLHPGLELEKIRLLGLPAAQQMMICGDNILRLMGIGPRAQRAKNALAQAGIALSYQRGPGRWTH